MALIKQGITLLMALTIALPAAAQRNQPDIEVSVPPEVFSTGGHRPPPCNQCCIYQDQQYSEGSVIRVEGVLMQCQRDDKRVSTHPLVWRRVRE